MGAVFSRLALHIVKPLIPGVAMCLTVGTHGVHADDNQGNSSTGLSLFFSEQEQRVLDARQSTELKPDKLSTLDQPHNPVPSAELFAEYGKGDYPRRYDGVVMRGDLVLDAWFDSSRYIKSQYGADFVVNRIDTSGVVNISLSGDEHQLHPGEEFTRRLSRSLSVSGVEQNVDGLPAGADADQVMSP